MSWHTAAAVDNPRVMVGTSTGGGGDIPRVQHDLLPARRRARAEEAVRLQLRRIPPQRAEMAASSPSMEPTGKSVAGVENLIAVRRLQE